MSTFDVAVLGAGTAGMSACLRAVDLGARVCLIEPNRFGPSPWTLLRQIGIRQAQAQWSCGMMRDDAVVVEEWIQLAESMADRVSLKLQEQLNDQGVAIKMGEGVLTCPGQVMVQSSAGEVAVEAANIIISTGSQATSAPTLPLDGEKICSPDDIFQLREIPKRVLVLGGGSTGAETAEWYNFFGSKVFLCCEEPRLLSDDDPDLVDALESSMKKQKIKVLAGKRVISIFKDEDGIDVTLDGGIKFTVDRIIRTADRTAVTGSVQARALGIRLGESGEILIDEMQQSSTPGIFAVGSVTGRISTEALSEEEGRVAAANACGKSKTLKRNHIPRIIHSIPEIASVGLAADTAHHHGFRAVMGRVDLKNLPGSFAEPDDTRWVKIVAEKKTGKVLGGQVVSEHASELIPIVLMSLKKGLTVKSLGGLSAGSATEFQGIRYAAKACSDALKSES